MGMTGSTPRSRIEVRGLTKRYGRETILDHLDFSVAPAEFVSILGRSGSGKSTLLRLISGLDNSYASGSITVDTRPSIMFQDSRLLPWLTTGQNVTLGTDFTPKDPHVRELFERVGLRADQIDVWPKTLSGGQAQRAALARALICKPRLLVLDEPFGALDSLTRMKMQELLVEIRHDYEPSVVLVTHDVEEALVLSDRIEILSAGHFAHHQNVSTAFPRDRSDPWIVSTRSSLLATLT